MRFVEVDAFRIAVGLAHRVPCPTACAPQPGGTQSPPPPAPRPLQGVQPQGRPVGQRRPRRRRPADPGIADSGHLSDDLSALFDALGEAARDLGIGVLGLIDELQEATAAELAALNTAVHNTGQANVPLPVIVIGAGLPSLPAHLADATSYAERLYDYRSIGLLLDDDAARDALTIPSTERGVEWDEEGLLAAVRTEGGYPYFIQAIGKHVCDNARRSPILPDDVEVGLAEARREVDDGLYHSRWERATPVQRDVLRSLAAIGGDEAASVADVARHMGRAEPPTSPSLGPSSSRRGSPTRRNGASSPSPSRMHDFILRQP